LSRLLCPAFGRHHGNYLVTLYLLVKLLYIGNVVGQLYMLNVFLGASYHSYGVDVVSALINGTDWSASPMFPRVTLCDLRVRPTDRLDMLRPPAIFQSLDVLASYVAGGLCHLVQREAR